MRAKWIVAGLLVIAALILLVAVDPYYLRKKTVWERTDLHCLPGIYTKNDAVLGNFSIISVFLGWGDRLAYPAAVGGNRNVLLMVTWEPYLRDDPKQSLLPGITAGRYDRLITNFALQIRRYGRPVLLRWGHEMNGNWYPWSGAGNSRDPEIYVRAYRHIHDLFEQADCGNVLFLFSVNDKDVPAESWNRFERYYPGGRFVDVIGIDVYNWGDTKQWPDGSRSRWTSAKNLIRPAYERIVRRFPDKPIVISEVGSSSSGGDKITWIRDFFSCLPARFPAIKAFVWFDLEKETDWGISRNKSTWQLVRQELSRDYFVKDPRFFVRLIGTRRKRGGRHE
jgi:hypothetical protein